MIAPSSMILALLVSLGALQQHTTPKVSVRFEPPVISVERDSTGFVQTMVNIYSIAGDSIRITGVKGSCACANASVQRPVMFDSIPGKIYLAINAGHFTDSVNYVDYTITHTGSGSPSGYRVVVRLPKEKR